MCLWASVWVGGGEPCHLLIIQRDKLGGFKDSSCDQLDILLKGACEDSCSLSSHHQGRTHTFIGLPPSGPSAHGTSDLAKRKVKMAEPHLARSLSLLRCWKKDGSQMSCSSWHTRLHERPGSASLTCRVLRGGHITCPWQKS